MSRLAQALNGTAKTDNGMDAFHSTNSALVDLFFDIGASRGRFKHIEPMITKSLATDPEQTVRLLLWARDAREGAGERQHFRDAIRLLANNGHLDDEKVMRLCPKIVELGRHDDLFAFVGTEFEHIALDYYAMQLVIMKNGLAAKWAPRKGPIANKLRLALKMTPKEYRKFVVELTNVVETKMCDQRFTEIEFDKVPSVAMSRYMRAFETRAPEQWKAYRASLEKGETKVNAGAVYPHSIIHAFRNGGDKRVAAKQWEALPDYLEGSETVRILPVVDTSASMDCGINGTGYGRASGVSCMDVALALGLYLSERNRGVFKDHFMTFSRTPTMQHVKGAIHERYNQMKRANWSMNTDFKKTFEVILKEARKHNLPEADMPTHVLVLSDMQFDRAGANRDALKTVAYEYEKYGYNMPQLIFWNLNARDNKPATVGQDGVALISGFSPSVMQSVLKADLTNLNPMQLVWDTIGNIRYDW